jgi:hypothetical protein
MQPEAAEIHNAVILTRMIHIRHFTQPQLPHCPVTKKQ